MAVLRRVNKQGDCLCSHTSSRGCRDRLNVHRENDFSDKLQLQKMYVDEGRRLEETRCKIKLARRSNSAYRHVRLRRAQVIKREFQTQDKSPINLLLYRAVFFFVCV